MADGSSSEQSSAITFTGFVLSLAHTAAVHLGDVADPVSGATSEPRLDLAFQMIEILGLLEAKTRGNLSAEERQMLEQLLYELRMRYVEVQQSQTSAPDDSGPRIIIP
jgi:hypothetical protein